MTVNDVVMALTAAALRRWLLDHDALPEVPLVGAVPVSIRTPDQRGSHGNQVSVMLAELPTHLADPEERMQFMRASMLEAKRAFVAVPASLLQDLSTLIPTALSGLAARALFKLATVPGVPFNLFVSNVPGPQRPLYIAGAEVEGIYPVSAVTDMTGGLNITLFSYHGSLDFGLIACREMVPDVWNLIGYLGDAMAEMLALVPKAPEERGTKRTPSSKPAAEPSRTTRHAGEERRVADGSAGGAVGDPADGVDEGLVQGGGEVVAHAGHQQQLRAGDRLRGGPAPGDVHHLVVHPVDHQGGHVQLAQAPGPVRLAEDREHLPGTPGGADAPVPGLAGPLEHRLLGVRVGRRADHLPEPRRARRRTPRGSPAAPAAGGAGAGPASRRCDARAST